MTGKRVRPGDAGKLAPARDFTTQCPSCSRTKCWGFSTNGDGASVQFCVHCGHVQPFGKYYQDQAVGVRLIALSTLSAIFTSKPKLA